MNYLPEETFEPLFGYLEACNGVRHDPNRHPEGDVLQHTLHVLCHAFRESDDLDLILAAMLHDIGKVEDMHRHVEIACDWLEDKVSVKTLWLIKNHMRIWLFLKGEMKRLMKVRELVEHPWFGDLCLLARWDALAKLATVEPAYDKESILAKFKTVAEKHFRTPPPKAICPFCKAGISKMKVLHKKGE